MRRELKRLDYLGLVLYCGGLIMLLLGITWGGKLYDWDSAHIIGLLVGGIATLVVFGLWGLSVHPSRRAQLTYRLSETYNPFPDSHALIPVKILKDTNFVALAATGSVATMIYTSMNVLWPQMVESLFTENVMQIGWYSVGSPQRSLENDPLTVLA